MPEKVLIPSISMLSVMGIKKLSNKKMAKNMTTARSRKEYIKGRGWGGQEREYSCPSLLNGISNGRSSSQCLRLRKI